MALSRSKAAGSAFEVVAAEMALSWARILSENDLLSLRGGAVLPMVLFNFASSSPMVRSNISILARTETLCRAELSGSASSANIDDAITPIAPGEEPLVWPSLSADRRSYAVVPPPKHFPLEA